MKIAVISDIHGNIEALNAVFDDIITEQCDKIFSLGDYAMAGPEPDKAIDWFIEQQRNPNFKMIQGNTDKMIAEYTEEFYEKNKEVMPVMMNALKNDNSILSAEQLAFLRMLPDKLELECEGVKILLVHGSPRRNNEDILPDTPIKTLEEIISGVTADIILCGHTHIPCGFQTSTKQTIVNVGSVGRPFTEEPKACYLKLTIENGSCIFEHKFIDYDKETASEKVKNRNFNGSEKLAETLLNPQNRHF